MDQDLKYPSQHAVLDAFMSPPAYLVGRITVAERAISARLTERNPNDHEERLALHDALRVLRVLSQEARVRMRPAQPKKEEEDIT